MRKFSLLMGLFLIFPCQVGFSAAKSQKEKRVNTIIFDLGGVLVEIDWKKTLDEFDRLGQSHIRKGLTRKGNNLKIKATEKASLFHQFEMGKISEQEFRPKIMDHFAASVRDPKTLRPISKKEFEKAWNAMIIRVPLESIRILQELRKTYRLALFSNINELHYSYFKELLKRDVDMEIEEFNTLFEGGAYYSHLFGYRKPSEEGFLRILSDNKLSPEEAVFVDDLEDNLRGAKKAGLYTIQILTPKELSTVNQKIELLQK